MRGETLLADIRLQCILISESPKPTTAHFSNRFTFPKFLVMNAESLNFDKVTKLEILSQLHKIDKIAVTEDQAESPDL